jgi:hypothetical protein
MEQIHSEIDELGDEEIIYPECDSDYIKWL